MPTIRATTEIAATPAEVRKVFLDFESYPTWAKAHFTSIEVTSGDKNDLKVGDNLKVCLTGATFTPAVTANTPEEFRWLGSIPYIFSGEHVFQFQPSTVTPGHTHLVQQEEFTGLLSFIIGPTWSQGIKTQAGFEAFNRELKARAEGNRS